MAQLEEEIMSNEFKRWIYIAETLIVLSQALIWAAAVAFWLRGATG